jgi:hypothetical protein
MGTKSSPRKENLCRFSRPKYLRENRKIDYLNIGLKLFKICYENLSNSTKQGKEVRSQSFHITFVKLEDWNLAYLEKI